MSNKFLAPARAALGHAFGSSKAMVNAVNRVAFIAVAAAIALACSPVAMTSTAHADRGWSMSSTVSQTYKKRNWSGAAKLGHPAKKSGYVKKKKSKKSYTKKSRSNKSAKKKNKSYRRNKSAKSKRKTSKKRAKVASINKTYKATSGNKKSVTSGGVRWTASSKCLNGRLKSIIYQVAAKYGSVTVNSTCRSKKHNARVGGAKRSQHLTGNAVDFRVHGKYGAAYAFLKSASGIGGYKHYGGGLFHIDAGPRRTW